MCVEWISFLILISTLCEQISKLLKSTICLKDTAFIYKFQNSLSIYKCQNKSLEVFLSQNKRLLKILLRVLGAFELFYV